MYKYLYLCMYAESHESFSWIRVTPWLWPTPSQFQLYPGQQQSDVGENPRGASSGRVPTAVVSPAPTASLPPGSDAQHYPVTSAGTCRTRQRTSWITLKKKKKRERNAEMKAGESSAWPRSRMVCFFLYLAGISSSSLWTSTQNRHGWLRPAHSLVAMPTFYSLKDVFTLGWFNKV